MQTAVKKTVRFLTSLRLTVACLAVGILLVFFGTLAQVNEGLYNAQERWFRSFFVWTQGDPKLPMFPGGYLIGTILLVNLLAAHIARFQLSWKKLGIHVTHAGIVLLLVGQLATDMFSKEMQMSFAEGESRCFSVNPQASELVFISDTSDAFTNKVVAIPAALLIEQKQVSHPDLPFTVRLKESFVNADVRQRAPMMDTNPPPATEGHGRNVTLIPLPETRKMDERNLPAITFELAGPQGSLGTWLGHAKLRDQEITVGDKLWQMSFRFEREYHPFTVELIKTTHEIYRGTGTPGRPDTAIPKNFQSRVKLDNHERRETREVDIRMNEPLRYEGLTFYQYQMGRDEVQQNRGTSTLQVVRNPGWLAPYAGCVLVGGGLIIQFLMHLIGFLRKRRAS